RPVVAVVLFPDKSHIEEPAAGAPEYSDEALALRFASKYANQLRYVAKKARWFRWGGTRWQEDTTLTAMEYARFICRAASQECSALLVAKVIASARTVAAVEKLARSDRKLAATVDQWDANPWLLNTPNGTIDLKTGKSH